MSTTPVSLRPVRGWCWLKGNLTLSLYFKKRREFSVWHRLCCRSLQVFILLIFLCAVHSIANSSVSLAVHGSKNVRKRSIGAVSSESILITIGSSSKEATTTAIFTLMLWLHVKQKSFQPSLTSVWNNFISARGNLSEIISKLFRRFTAAQCRQTLWVATAEGNENNLSRQGLYAVADFC